MAAASIWQQLREVIAPRRASPTPKPAPRAMESYLPWSAESVADALLVAGSPAADRKKLVECCRQLSYSPSGASDIQVIVEAGVRVQFDMRAGGAGYRPASRLIILNRMLTPARTATELIHEATHARLKVER